MRGLSTILVLVVLSGGVFYLSGLRRTEDDKPLLHVATENPVEVQVATPQRSEVVRLVQAPGEVEPVLEVDISSEIVSKIEEMPIEEGDIVAEGDLLCRLDDDQLLAAVESGEARVNQIKASVMHAEADFEKADRDMQRQMRLSEESATSVSEIADYHTAFKRSKAQLEMRKQELVEAEATLKRLREDLKRTVIYAPISGVVAKLNAKQGEVVITGTMNNPGTVIMTISDLSRMQVRTRVDEIDVPLVKAGQRARIYLQADHDLPVPGRVVRVAAKGTRPVGRDVVTFETLLEVEVNDHRIKPNMTANVEIEVARHEDALTIPVEAIVHRLRKDLADDIVEEFDRRQAGLDFSDRARQAQYIKVVYVMSDGKAEIRLVDTGIADSRHVELVGGVLAEDEVIIGPYRSLDQLKDGRTVALMELDKKEGAVTDEEPGQEDVQSAQNQPADDAAQDG